MPASDNQVGRFLTALDLSLWANDPNSSFFVEQFRKQFALRAIIIGHEIIGDNLGAIPL